MLRFQANTTSRVVQSRYGIGCYLHSIANFLNISKISNNSINIILLEVVLGFSMQYATSAIPTDSCEASVVRSKKACGTNRKRSMSVGIVGEQEHEKGIKYTNHTTLPLRAFPTFLYPFHRYRRTEDNTQCNSTCHLKSFQSHRGSHPAVIHNQVVRSIIDSGTRN